MQPNSPWQECKICFEGQRTVIHSYVQGGLDEGRSTGDELRFGQLVGTSTSVLAEEATAFPKVSCLLGEATGILKQK